MPILGHLSALYTSAHEHGFSEPRMRIEFSVFSSSQDCDTRDEDQCPQCYQKQPDRNEEVRPRDLTGGST